jgi:RNA polymerase sigma factor (sigma-70 family)
VNGILGTKYSRLTALAEEDLIKGCIKQDARCQRMLFEAYAGKMMAVCLRYTGNQAEAEDVLQEGFIKIFRYIAQFKGEGSFEGWLRRIFVNTALRSCKKKRISPVEISEQVDQQAMVETVALSALGETELLRLINALPEGYRLVFNLSVIEGYNHDEIAAMLDIQPATSRSQLVKARRMLQQQIIHSQHIAV